MGLSIYNLFKAALLVMNALAVLHERRFLKPYRLHGDGANVAVGALGEPSGEPSSAARRQVASLLRVARGMRWPLVIVNSLVVVIELLFG